MKRQLDRLKGKRLVTGDPNLMTKDEICINATPNGVEVKEIGTDGKIKDLTGSGDNGGGDIKDKYVYYIPNNEYNSINFTLDEYADLYALLEEFQALTGPINSKVKVHYRQNADKYKDGYYLYSLIENLNCYGIIINNDLRIQIASYEESNGIAHTEGYTGFNATFDELCEFYKQVGRDIKSLIEQYFKRCTKEEFYKDVLMYDLTYEDFINSSNQ